MIENNSSYFLTKTYVVGTQKNRLNETVLLSTQNMFKLMGKKIMTILCSKVLLIWMYVGACALIGLNTVYFIAPSLSKLERPLAPLQMTRA